MKQNFLCKAVKVAFIVLFFNTIIISAYPQLPPVPDHKPFMWVPMEQGQKQINFFNSLKLPKIDVTLGGAQNNRFVLGNFYGMFQYLLDTYGESFVALCVHIGVCSGEGIPAGYNNKLIFIFEPIVTGVDAGYYILPKPFDASVIADFKRSKPIIDNWKNKYESAMPLLLTTIASHRDNTYEDPVTHLRKKSDTKYVTYCVKDLIKFYNFQKYYAKDYNISPSLIGYLASYLSSGDRQTKFKKRIITEFNFMDNSGQDFYLDSIAGFMNLTQENSACSFPAKLALAADNGQLCPTYCPK